MAAPPPGRNIHSTLYRDTDEENIDFMGLGSSAVGNTRGIIARERARYGVRAGYNF